MRSTFIDKIAPHASLAALVSVLAACSVGPDFKRPKISGTSSFVAQPLPDKTAASTPDASDGQRLAQGEDIPAQWWTLFQNPALNELIEGALKTNADLESAHAALRVAMENARAQQGAYYPSVSANFAASRNLNSVALAPTLSSGTLLYNLYQADLSASWTLDIWGGNRRAVEALDAQTEAQRFQLEATQLALTTNVVADAVQEASLRAQIDATNDIIAAEKESLGICAGNRNSARSLAPMWRRRRPLLRKPNWRCHPCRSNWPSSAMR